MDSCVLNVSFGGFVLLMSLVVNASNINYTGNLPLCEISSTEDTPISPYIVGGLVAGRHEFPGIVNLRNITEVTPYCSGSLIDWVCELIAKQDLIVTAAHCLFYKGTLKPIETKHIVLTAGDYNTSCIDDWKQIGYIESTLVHSGYQIYPILHDIALIKVKSKFTQTEAVHPISLPSYNILEFAQEGTVAGWGFTETQVYSEVLLKANITLNQSQTCTLFDKESQFCAGGNGKDSCGGDSGGPLMCHDKQYNILCGIVSFGPEDCGIEPGTYTNVYSYLGWIIENRGFKPCSVVTWWQYILIILVMTLICSIMVLIGYKIGINRRNNDQGAGPVSTASIANGGDQSDQVGSQRDALLNSNAIVSYP